MDPHTHALRLICRLERDGYLPTLHDDTWQHENGNKAIVTWDKDLGRFMALIHKPDGSTRPYFGSR